MGNSEPGFHVSRTVVTDVRSSGGVSNKLLIMIVVTFVITSCVLLKLTCTRKLQSGEQTMKTRAKLRGFDKPNLISYAVFRHSLLIRCSASAWYLLSRPRNITLHPSEGTSLR